MRIAFITAAFPMLAVLLSACTTMPPSTQHVDWQGRLARDLAEPRVVMQVCTHKPVSSILVQSIERKSHGSGMEQQFGTSLAGQPLFEATGAVPGEQRAFAIRYRDEQDQYVFEPPSRLSTKVWSDWQRPSFVTSERLLGFQMLHGGSYERRSAPQDSPQARFLLMPFLEFTSRISARKKANAVDAIPGC